MLTKTEYEKRPREEAFINSLPYHSELSQELEQLSPAEFLGWLERETN